MSFLNQKADFVDKTRTAFLWTRLLNIPFWTIFNMLVIILYKDLHATPLQITAIIAIKPIASLFSPYWSSLIYQRRDRLVSNLVWANILKFFPFLTFPWLNNTWLFVLAFGSYMLFARAVIPAWMEIIKLNIKGTAKEKIFAFVSAIDYIGSAILPIAFGWILDDYQGAWRWVFFGSAFIGILSTLFLFRIPVEHIDVPAKSQTQQPISIWEEIAKPWKHSWRLLRERPDFAKFQIGFMLGGGGLMFMQTSLPAFFVDVLQLSYMKIAMAVTVCKAVGFAASSPLWVKWYDKVNIFKVSSRVTLFAAAFPLLIMAATTHVFWVYAAYIAYGMMQAGSELSWHMSGPAFAKEEDSSLYSSTNVLTVGIRGCFIPLLGNCIYTMTNSVTVMLISFLLCMLATERLWNYSKPEPVSV